MRGKVLVAVFAAALVAVGVVASASSAGQTIPQALLLTQATAVPYVGPVQFGTVPIDTQVVKPVVIFNRSNESMYYGGATWPNLQYPGAGVQPYPKGFWNVSGSGQYFPCYDIAPKSGCVLKFGWQPFETGTQSATFMMWYVGSNSGNTYESNTLTMIGGGY